MSQSTVGIHDEFVKSVLPNWYTSASVEERQILHRDILHGRQLQAGKVNALSGLKGLYEFAAGKLSDALSAHEAFGPGFDLEHDELWIAKVETWGAPLGLAGVSGGRTQVATGFTKTSLLKAALHNYQIDEVNRVRQDGFSVLHRAGSGAASVELAARFMELCRTLDLGGQYQRHLGGVFRRSADTLAAGAATAAQVKQAIDACELNKLHINAHIARMKLALNVELYHAVLSASGYERDGLADTDMEVFQLSMLGFKLRDMLVFKSASGVHIVYSPAEPHTPFSKHDSFDDLTNSLRFSLIYGRYQNKLVKYVARDQQQSFLEQARRFVLRSSPQFEGPPQLHLKLDVVSNLKDDYFSTRMLQQTLDEARLMAVPSADRDRAQDQQALARRRETVMDILNLGALFVPGMGEIMMAVVGAQLLGEVFEGVTAWSHGETEQALEYLADVALNVAALLILHQAGKAISSALPSAGKRSVFVEKMVPIQAADGKTRLWTGDITPFAARVTLPEGLQPTAEGILTHDGRHYIALEGRVYPVEQDSALGRWRLKVPGNKRLSPVFEHYGAGAWRHEGENPAIWGGYRSLRRLGPRFAELSEQEAEQVMSISGVDEAGLAALHLDSQRCPAALLDTLERLQMDRQALAVAGDGEDLATVFEQLNLRREATDEPGIQLLQRDFPGLPTLVARELLSNASEQQRGVLLTTRRVPLAISERARVAVQEARLDRALEGFFLRSRAYDPDTEKLAVQLLERLPGWPEGVRIELSDGVVSDPPLPGRLVVNRHEHANLFAAVLQALPARSRQAMGFADSDQGAAALARRIRDEAIGKRRRSAKLLGLQPVRSVFTAPVRQTDGRLGYLLSGRGRFSAGPRLAADVERGHLAADLRRLCPDALNIERYIADQEALGRTIADMRREVREQIRELLALEASLGGWVDPLPSAEVISEQQRLQRQAFSESLVRAWRTRSAPLMTLDRERALTLHNLDMALLSDLPDLPGHYARISNLNIDAVTASADQLDGLLRHFPNVTELRMNNMLLSRWPEQLHALANLSSLTLTGIRGLTIDQALMNRLMQLRGLYQLDLSENSFGQIHTFELPGLRVLIIRDAQLTQWPQWVDELSLSSLDISSNGIGHLPTRIIDNQGAAQAPLVIHANGNPLDAEELSRFHNDNNGRFGGSYRVEADYQPLMDDDTSSEVGSDIWNGWEWEGEHGGSPSTSPDPDISTWLVDGPGREVMNASLRTAWRGTEQAGDAPHLLKLIQRLKETPDYKENYSSLAMDVRDVLEAAANDSSLRGRLDLMAHERLFGSEQTCQDGVRLIFSDLRIAVLEGAALADESHFRPGEALLRMVRGLFRLDQVEAIAAEDIALRTRNVDAAEVRMAYRIGLAHDLQLPGQPSSMRWAALAGVSPQALEMAQSRVLEREAGPAFAEYAASNSRWANFLRNAHADDFSHLRADLDAQLDSLEVLSVTDPEAYQQQNEEMANLFQVRERSLLESLSRDFIDDYF